MPSKEFKVATFGEIMLRLSPPGVLRFDQAVRFDAVYGGGEANVAVSLARLGLDVEYVTRLPASPIGRACIQSLRQHGVGVSNSIYGGERLGIYFLEKGAGPRPSQVVYDRANSSFAQVAPGMIDWERVFQGCNWFHWTGITPAISASASETCLEGIRIARKKGLTVSCDLNYRKKLWQWGQGASDVMPEMVSLCDIAIGNEEDADRIFGIAPPNIEVTEQGIDGRGYESVCQALSDRFPNLRTIAITLRGSHSADHNSWSAICWSEGRFLEGPTHQIRNVRDRVGGGDSFAAGFIYALLNSDQDMKFALRFAIAASCLKHTIIGDANLATLEEIEQLMCGDSSGRISR